MDTEYTAPTEDSVTLAPSYDRFQADEDQLEELRASGELIVVRDCDDKDSMKAAKALKDRVREVGGRVNASLAAELSEMKQRRNEIKAYGIRFASVYGAIEDSLTEKANYVYYNLKAASAAAHELRASKLKQCDAAAHAYSGLAALTDEEFEARLKDAKALHKIRKNN